MGTLFALKPTWLRGLVIPHVWIYWTWLSLYSSLSDCNRMRRVTALKLLTKWHFTSQGLITKFMALNDLFRGLLLLQIVHISCRPIPYIHCESPACLYELQGSGRIFAQRREYRTDDSKLFWGWKGLLARHIDLQNPLGRAGIWYL